MRWYYNLNVGTKLAIAFGSLVVIIMLSGILSLRSIDKSGDNLENVYVNNLLPIATIGEIRNTVQFTRILMRDAILVEDSLKRIVYAQRIDSIKVVNDSLTRVYQQAILNEEERRIFAKLQSALTDFFAARTRIVQYALQNRPSDAVHEIYNVGGRNSAHVAEALHELTELNRKQAEAFKDESRKFVRSTMIMGITLTLLSLVLTLLFRRLLVHSLSKPLKELTEKAQKVASGDTNQLVQAMSTDEIGLLGQAFNVMVSNIRQGIERLAEEKRSVELKIEQAVQQSEHEKLYLKRSVEAMLQSVEQFANGDLTQVLPLDHSARQDDIRRLFSGYNNAVVTMRELVGSVVESVQATASASAEISASTEQMSAGMSEQAQQTVAIAQAIERMADTIATSTEQATKAARESLEASNDAQEGGKVISATIEGINRIAAIVVEAAEMIRSLGKNSEQISEIVKVIEEIADQTNLLALNAAIEAARAGDQGRGFAVVADEVRKLAERTTQATQEIAATVTHIQADTMKAVASMNTSTAEVERGKEAASKAASALERIIGATRSASADVTLLAQSSTEQAAMSNEIADNVATIRAVAEQAARTTEQIARTAEDLSRLTEHLQRSVSHFVTERA
jgi:methyl-accepting chemotaxis protein